MSNIGPYLVGVAFWLFLGASAVAAIVSEHKKRRFIIDLLRTTVEKFRADELAHRDEALAAGAEQAPAYEALTTAIKMGSRLAIWLSTRI